MSADIILAADHATFALPEINSGTIADAAALKLPKRIPYHIAMELLFTGRWIDCTEAHRWGLVNHIVPAAELMTRARELAGTLVEGPPLVYAAIKEVTRAAENMRFQDALDGITGRTFPTVDRLYRVKIRSKVPVLLPRNGNLSGVVDDSLDEVKPGRFLGNVQNTAQLSVCRC